MGTEVRIEPRAAQHISMVQGIWEALFDHHVSIGAAGLKTIAREMSWPRRKKHYEHIFASQANAGLWVAVLGDDPVGYALAYEVEVGSDRAMLLETLSVLAEARGHGIGTRLMQVVDEAARAAEMSVGVVDVLAGNARARELYLRHGYRPSSEAWIRSTQADTSGSDAKDPSSLAQRANQLGLKLTTSPGPDDTWESADEIVELTVSTSTTGETSAATVRFAAPYSGETGPDATALNDFFLELIAAGLWTIRFEIAAAPEAEQLRTFLSAQGFRLSTERLLRRSSATTPRSR